MILYYRFIKTNQRKIFAVPITLVAVLTASLTVICIY